MSGVSPRRDVSGLGVGGRLWAGLLVAVVVVAGIGWFSLSGRLAGLQYANIPLVHPFPPPGHFVNPYTGDPRDILSSAEAARVRADLLRDGELQLDALARGDPKMLPQTATGNFLAKLIQSVAANNAKGILEQEQNHLDSVVVGRLTDPADPNVTWCVEERGSGVTTFVEKSTGRPVSKLKFHFQSRFWLARVGDRYLIADALINSVPESQA